MFSFTVCMRQKLNFSNWNFWWGGLLFQMQTIYCKYHGILIVFLIFSDNDFDSDLIVINIGWNLIYEIRTFICLGK